MAGWKDIRKRLPAALQGNIVDEQKKILAKLKAKSLDAFGIVISSIKNLNEINGEINTAMNLIEGYQTELATTQNQLKDTKDKNRRILDKFQALLDEESGAIE